MNGVHFILTGGELTPRYRRAIVSAGIHMAPITLWYAGSRPDTRGLDIEVRPIALPTISENGLHPAHLWDVLAFKVGCEEGGLVLGLDTISVRPALDLLGDYDLVCSRDFSEAEMASGITISPYTMTFVACQGSEIVREMYEEAQRRALEDSEVWGFTGPEVLRTFAERYPDRVVGAPYPALCGWNSRYIWRFYMGLERPHENTRIIHLFSQGEPELWAGDYASFIAKHSDLIQQRSPLNDALLACPPIVRWTSELERDVYLRPETSDEQTWMDTFVHRYHVPPETISPRTVLDLGANVGLTAAHFRAIWPQARIWAVEMDAESASMCGANFQGGPIIVAAVGIENGQATYAKGPWAASNSLRSPGATMTPVIAMRRLIDGMGEHVDFVKMDIEGTEWDLFEYPEGWAERIGSLLVELHGSEPSDILVKRAMDCLSEIGFSVARHTVHPHAVWARRT